MADVQLLMYSSCTLPGLTGVYGCRDNKGGVEIQFNLETKRAGSPHVVKSSKDCCCFCQSSVDIIIHAPGFTQNYEKKFMACLKTFCFAVDEIPIV